MESLVGIFKAIKHEFWDTIDSKWDERFMDEADEIGSTDIGEAICQEEDWQ